MPAAFLLRLRDQPPGRFGIAVLLRSLYSLSAAFLYGARPATCIQYGHAELYPAAHSYPAGVCAGQVILCQKATGMASGVPIYPRMNWPRWMVSFAG